MIDHLHNDQKLGLHRNFEFAAYSVLAMMVWNIVYLNYFYNQDEDLTVFEGQLDLSVST